MSRVERPVPELVAGDRLTRAEFERRYEAMPRVRKAELIEGVVYLPSPVRWNRHSEPHGLIVAWLGVYSGSTPGVRFGADGTVRLDQENEPQPDGFLRIEESRGGQSRVDADDYVAGAPELAAEVTASTASYDMHDKLRAYRRNGVREYIAWRTEDRELDWFVLREGRYDRLARDDGGTIRSETFPGLWLDVEALLAHDMARVLATLQGGLASPEHAAVVARLSAAR